MNFKVVFKIVGRVLTMEGLVMLVPMLVSIYYGEDFWPYVIASTVVTITGMNLACINASKDFFIREGFFTVGLIWLATGLVGALPFYYCDLFPSFTDCLFESFSGFTTTGASILVDIEALPKGILFWRALTHWLGGMGVLVLATALIPTIGIRTKYLTQAESPGPVFSKLVPKQAQSSKILYSIYCGLTVLEAVLLRIAGMPWYDSWVHAFSTAGTGGFSNMNASIGAYNSMAIDMIIAVFLILFSLNFTVHFLLLTKRFREVFHSDELRFFLFLVAASTIGIMLNIRHLFPDWIQTFRFAFFQVTSVISTAGFSNTDWLFWPLFSQTILVLIMFCGGCAGSTGGGIKCSRILIMLRVIRREIHSIIHPRSVEVVKLDGKVVDEKTIRSVITFIGCYLFLLLGITLVVSLDNVNFSEAFTAALTCMSNAGPGLGMIGPSGNYSTFSDSTKIILSFAMVVGRLEIFPILILFSPSAWYRS